jgi:hypothetical protein
MQLTDALLNHDYRNPRRLIPNYCKIFFSRMATAITPSGELTKQAGRHAYGGEGNVAAYRRLGVSAFFHPAGDAGGVTCHGSDAVLPYPHSYHFVIVR